MGKSTGKINVKKKEVVPTMTPKKAEAIKVNLPSQRAQYQLISPQMSMEQIGKRMSKSGPRKNLRETAAVVKGKIQKAFKKIGKNSDKKPNTPSALPITEKQAIRAASDGKASGKEFFTNDYYDSSLYTSRKRYALKRKN
jgi:hypothetical protein